MALFPRIEPASPIDFYQAGSTAPYLTLTMAQVKSLRERGKFHTFTDWARKRRGLAVILLHVH